MKKTFVTLGALILATAAQAQDANNSHKLSKVWESDATLKTPESVYFDAARKVLYVSNIDGEPWTADGKGSIGKVGLDGKVISAEWITGLDCPKGMALSDDGKWLYVGDCGGLVVIDVDAGKIKNKIAVPRVACSTTSSTTRARSTSSDSKGKKVYASRTARPACISTRRCSRVRTVSRCTRARSTCWTMTVSTASSRTSRSRCSPTGMPGGADGLENVKGDDFIVSVWSGAVWYVKADGSKELLFDGKAVAYQDRRHRLGSEDQHGVRAHVLQEHGRRLQGRVSREIRQGWSAAPTLHLVITNVIWRTLPCAGHGCRAAPPSVIPAAADTEYRSRSDPGWRPTAH